MGKNRHFLRFLSAGKSVFQNAMRKRPKSSAEAEYAVAFCFQTCPEGALSRFDHRINGLERLIINLETFVCIERNTVAHQAST